MVSLNTPPLLAPFAVKKVQEEGKYAIDSPGSPSQYDIPPEDYALRKCDYFHHNSFSNDLI